LARIVLIDVHVDEFGVLERPAMKTVEIITVRLDPRSKEPLLRELPETLELRKWSDDQLILEIYRHATVPTDLSGHLRSESPSAQVLPSDLGRHLASELREFGQISHSTWFEEAQ
jgi:hypothetical protein